MQIESMNLIRPVAIVAARCSTLQHVAACIRMIQDVFRSYP